MGRNGAGEEEKKRQERKRDRRRKEGQLPKRPSGLVKCSIFAKRKSLFTGLP